MTKPHKIHWKCYDCHKITKTNHSNIPKKCNNCGGEYFKYIKCVRKSKNIEVEEFDNIQKALKRLRELM